MVPKYTMHVRGVLAWTVCAAVACGGDKLALPIDAPKIVDTHDSAPAPRCDPTAAFGSAINLGGVNTALNEATARLSADELTLVFARLNADGTWDLYTASRTSATEPFGSATVMASLNSVYTELWPTLTPDSLGIYFNTDRNNSMTGNEDVFYAGRASTTADFDAPAIASGFEPNDNQPYVAGDGLAVYFSSSTRPETTGGTDLFYAPIDGSGNVGTAQVLIGGVNTPANEQVPVVTPDELTLFFCRSNGTDDDIFSATRASTSSPWSAGSAVPGYATAGVEEVPTWISPDGCDLYFYDNGSDMPGAQGLDDMYEIVRGP
jgi:Tol biopolymer transport system component